MSHTAVSVGSTPSRRGADDSTTDAACGNVTAVSPMFTQHCASPRWNAATSGAIVSHVRSPASHHSQGRRRSAARYRFSVELGSRSWASTLCSAQCAGWGNQVMALDTAQIGLNGSPTQVRKIFSPERTKGEILGEGESDPAGAATLLVGRLQEQDLL